jgi:hypothetical protein
VESSFHDVMEYMRCSECLEPEDPVGLQLPAATKTLLEEVDQWMYSHGGTALLLADSPRGSHKVSSVF